MASAQSIKLLSVTSSDKSTFIKVLINGEEKVFIGKKDKTFESGSESNLRTLDSFQKGYSIDRKNITHEDKKKDVIIPVVVSQDIAQLGTFMFSMSKMTNNYILYLLYKERLVNRYVDENNNIIYYDFTNELLERTGNNPERICDYLKSDFSDTTGYGDFSFLENGTDTLESGTLLPCEERQNYSNLEGIGEGLNSKTYQDKPDNMPFSYLFEFDNNYQYTADESQIFINFNQLKNHLSPFFNITVDNENAFKLWRRFNKLTNTNNELWTSYSLLLPQSNTIDNNLDVKGLFAPNAVNYNYDEEKKKWVQDSKQPYLNSKSFSDFFKDNYNKDLFDSNNKIDLSNGFSIHVDLEAKDFILKSLYSYYTRYNLKTVNGCPYWFTSKDFYNSLVSNDKLKKFFKIDYQPYNGEFGTVTLTCLNNTNWSQLPNIDIKTSDAGTPVSLVAWGSSLIDEFKFRYSDYYGEYTGEKYIVQYNSCQTGALRTNKNSIIDANHNYGAKANMLYNKTVNGDLYVTSCGISTRLYNLFDYLMPLKISPTSSITYSNLSDAPTYSNLPDAPDFYNNTDEFSKELLYGHSNYKIKELDIFDFSEVNPILNNLYGSHYAAETLPDGKLSYDQNFAKWSGNGYGWYSAISLDVNGYCDYFSFKGPRYYYDGGYYLYTAIYNLLHPTLYKNNNYSITDSSFLHYTGEYKTVGYGNTNHINWNQCYRYFINVQNGWGTWSDYEINDKGYAENIKGDYRNGAIQITLNDLLFEYQNMLDGKTLPTTLTEWASYNGEPIFKSNELTDPNLGYLYKLDSNNKYVPIKNAKDTDFKTKLKNEKKCITQKVVRLCWELYNNWDTATDDWGKYFNRNASNDRIFCKKFIDDYIKKFSIIDYIGEWSSTKYDEENAKKENNVFTTYDNIINDDSWKTALESNPANLAYIIRTYKERYNLLFVFAAFACWSGNVAKIKKGTQLVYKNFRIVPYSWTCNPKYASSPNNFTNKLRNTLEYDGEIYEAYAKKVQDYFKSPISIKYYPPNYNVNQYTNTEASYNSLYYNDKITLIDIFGLTPGGKFLSDVTALRTYEDTIINTLKNIKTNRISVDLIVALKDSLGYPKLIIDTYINGNKIVSHEHDNTSEEYKAIVNKINNMDFLNKCNITTYGKNLNNPNNYSYRKFEDFNQLKYYNISMWNYPLTESQINQIQFVTNGNISTSNICSEKFKIDDNNIYTEAKDGKYGKIFSQDKFVTKTVQLLENSNNYSDVKLFRVRDFDYIDKIEAIHKLSINEGRKSNLYSIKLRGTGLSDNPYSEKKDSIEYIEYEEFRLDCIAKLEAAINTICTKVEPLNTKLFKLIIES